ncbi:XapX domain-containing protein [Paenibacillus sp. yr247]|uniref:XapX domain-containing protein n=1 Tax=Paenibacillus sp. yr247 TaxID=1761880 RepID=UPI0008801F5D|nr:DUF1427 family protein [Paenibacillus sp. yr247]SDP12990.1 XapX domain-containing protein [Paenibacillus sp. yr247]
MKEVILAFAAGAFVGVVFRYIRLPLPAPPVFSAVMGIMGIYVGGKLVEWVNKLFT